MHAPTDACTELIHLGTVYKGGYSTGREHWVCCVHVLQWLWGWVHRGGGWGIYREGAVCWTAGGSNVFNGVGWWVVNCASG